MSELLRLFGFVLPLCLDTFAVSAAAGVSGLSVGRRLRLSLLFVAFEAGMPLVGLAVGAPLAARAGGIADYVAAGVLILLGGWMLWSDADDDEEKARRLNGAGGLTLIGLGVSISVDELAIGFSLGLTRLPPVASIILIALQALIASQLGFALGSRIGDRIREGAEKLAGVALVALGVLLVLLRLTGSG